MPRKTPSTATSANGKADNPVPSAAATTEQKLQQLEAEIKAEAAQAKQSTIAPTAAKPTQPTAVKAVAAPAPAQHPPTKPIVQTLDEFLESRSGRLIQTTCTVFLLTLPAYSFGFADGLLKGLSQAHSVTPASEIAPTAQPSIAPAAPIAPAK